MTLMTPLLIPFTYFVWPYSDEETDKKLDWKERDAARKREIEKKLKEEEERREKEEQERVKKAGEELKKERKKKKEEAAADESGSEEEKPSPKVGAKWHVIWGKSCKYWNEIENGLTEDGWLWYSLPDIKHSRIWRYTLLYDSAAARYVLKLTVKNLTKIKSSRGRKYCKDFVLLWKYQYYIVSQFFFKGANL